MIRKSVSIFCALAALFLFSYSNIAAQGGGITVNGVDHDLANKLQNCASAAVRFGDGASDRPRCFTFRYQVPTSGIKSATLHLAINSLDPSTETIGIATSQMYPSCAWSGGASCVILIGGPIPTGPSIDLDLFAVSPGINLGSNQNPPNAQQDVTTQLNSGVLYGWVQDDTVIYCAQLVLNGGDGKPLCTKENPNPGGSPTTPQNSAQCLGTPETITVSSTTADTVRSNTVLATAKSYEVQVSGVVGLFPNTTEGYDALFDYRQSGQPVPIDRGTLVFLNDKPISDWITAAGGSTAYRPDHTYTAILQGDGQPLAVRFMEGGSYTDNAGSFTVALCEASSGSVVLKTGQDTYNAGSPITVEWSGLSGEGNWITIVKQGTPDSSYGAWSWADNKPSGSKEFGGQEAGAYEARLYMNWPAGGYNVAARYPFRVEGSGSAAMSLQAPRRLALPNDLLLIPITLNNAANVANLNFDLAYNAAVIRPEGNLVKGNLLDNALFSANPSQAGLVRNGFAQTSGLSGTGTVVNIPFRIVGKPGDKSPLELQVTTINDPNGGTLKIEQIAGEIVITNSDGTLPGDGGNGTGGGNPKPAIPQGDCDGDLRVTELDALCALEMSVQLREGLAIMDVDNSGLPITSRDAVIILQRAVGQ